jgi:hypothetical protein
MQKEIYQEKTADDRKVYLRDTCDKIENFSYEKSYTNQDVELFCDRLSKIMIEVQQLEVELSRVKKEFTDKMKPSKKELSDLLNKIKFRSEMVTEQVYIFIDHERNEVGYYAGTGILVHKRMLKIDEHQRSIMGSMRTRQEVMDEDERDPDMVEEDDDDDNIVDIEAEFAEVEAEDRPHYPQKKNNNRVRRI